MQQERCRDTTIQKISFEEESSDSEDIYLDTNLKIQDEVSYEFEDFSRTSGYI